MKFTSTRTFESKIEPGVAFVLKKMNVRRRDQLEEAQRPFEDRLRPLREELAPLNKAYGDAWKIAKEVGSDERKKLILAGSTEAEALKQFPYGSPDFPDDQFKRWSELTEQIRKIDRQEMTPSAVRFVLVRIEGLEIDGETATLDSLLSDGPDELYQELAREVARELGLLDEEAANLDSPSISPAVEAGAKSIGPADPAGKPETITTAAA